MKYLILTIAFFYLNTRVFSQDSIKVRTEIDTFSTPQYESDYDAFFLKQEPQNSLLKFGTTALFRDYGVSAANYAFVLETRIKQGVSINLGFNIQDYSIRGVKNEPKSSPKIPMTFYVEMRNYLNKAREIAEKRSADNLIGTYAGVRTGISISPTFKGTTYFGEGVFGLQQSFLQRMRPLFTKKAVEVTNYVDINLGLGVAYNTVQKWSPSYRVQVQFGGLSNLTQKTTPQKDVNAMCDVYRCHEEEKRLFKIDLLNLVSVANSNSADIGLDMNYETKINNSAFSLNLGLNGIRYNLKTSAVNDRKIKGYTFKTYLEPRWYHRLRKEIAKGNSANNLSGRYWALQMGYKNYEKNNYESNVLTTTNQSDYAYTYLVFGYQQRMLKHFFGEYRFGVGAKSEKNLDGLVLNNGKNGGSYVGGFGEVKLGLAF
jgi:hypothetical protein